MTPDATLSWAPPAVGAGELASASLGQPQPSPSSEPAASGARGSEAGPEPESTLPIQFCRRTGAC